MNLSWTFQKVQELPDQSPYAKVMAVSKSEYGMDPNLTRTQIGLVSEINKGRPGVGDAQKNSLKQEP